MEAQTIRNFLNEYGAVCFDDVLLTPRYSTIKTRRDIKLYDPTKDTLLPGMERPVFSAPMDTVTGLDMAVVMAEMHAASVVHRYNSADQQWNEMPNDKFALSRTFAAVGSNDDDRISYLYDRGVRNFCVDVAHGHHKDVAAAIMRLKSREGTRVMAGNIATPEGYSFLRKAGADFIRVGVGGGSCCTTRIRTGHGVPTLTSVALCKIRALEEAVDDIKPSVIIADGGVRTSGDAVKAMAFGADAVMLGSVLAGTSAAPGDVVNGMKSFRGMASSEAQEEWRGWTSVAEGIATEIKYKGETREVLHDFIMGMKSGFSYSGARNLKEFRDRCFVMKQSPASIKEGLPHING